MFVKKLAYNNANNNVLSQSTKMASKMHYENKLIQIYRKFHLKKLKFFKKKSDIFHISAQNIDCGYSLEQM